MKIERNSKGEIRIDGELVGIRLRPEDGIGPLIAYLTQLKKEKESE